MIGKTISSRFQKETLPHFYGVGAVKLSLNFDVVFISHIFIIDNYSSLFGHVISSITQLLLSFEYNIDCFRHRQRAAHMPLQQKYRDFPKNDTCIYILCFAPKAVTILLEDKISPRSLLKWFAYVAEAANLIDPQLQNSHAWWIWYSGKFKILPILKE